MSRDNDRPTVAHRTIEQIKGMIASGRWGPGERLPTERQLADELGVSRSSIREAVGALTAMGVITSRHGAGIYLTQLAAHELLEAVGVAAEIWPDDALLHLIEVRRILESHATAAAAARLSVEDLQRLSDLITEMDEMGPGEAFVAADIEFHRIVVDAAGNPVITAMIDGMSGRTFRARVMRSRTQEAALRRTKDEHHRIYEALRERDPERSRMAAAQHISGVEQWLQAVIAAGALK
ncbi:MAG TPA: FadR/GntR family transcriptional regulator [Euzebya sp.]|nr:FadR/GntR family transcriptional regulator [Euzebya sp.]